MHTDPIADLLTRIRNSYRSGATSVEMPMSKIKLEIVKILQAESYVKSYEVLKDQRFPRLKVSLKYEDVRNRKPVLTHLCRISKPGLRKFRQFSALNPILRGLGIAILSTSKGVMTDRQARKLRVGGEVICEVW